jgi:3-oxoacyl-[acyl-carrier protein] reductase
MNLPLCGRAALVTGAGRGIGRAVALKLAREGAAVLVNDLDEPEAQAVVDEITAAGGRALTCAGSVAEAGFADRAVQACLGAFGSLDIVVNNAGYTWDGALHRMSEQQWQAMLDVHLTAPFRILRAAYAPFKQQRQADELQGLRVHRKVVNISSVVGLGGNAGQANYAAAKAGVIGLTKALSKEWGRLLVNVNCVAFGQIETRLTQPRGDAPERLDIDGQLIEVGVGKETLEMIQRQIPLGRSGTVEEAADAVYLLCAPESDYISGQVIVCGGGLTLA